MFENRLFQSKDMDVVIMLRADDDDSCDEEDDMSATLNLIKQEINSLLESQ